MAYHLAADVVVVVHLATIVFMVLGGFLAWRWRWVVGIHLPVMVWGVAVSVFGWRCPLTPLELTLRDSAGQAGYDGGFIDHYIVPVIYPSGLTPAIQVGLGVALLAINAVAYLGWWRHRAHVSPPHDRPLPAHAAGGFPRSSVRS